jgi:hypothetical protein
LAIFGASKRAASDERKRIGQATKAVPRRSPGARRSNAAHAITHRVITLYGPAERRLGIASAGFGSQEIRVPARYRFAPDRQNNPPAIWKACWSERRDSNSGPPVPQTTFRARADIRQPFFGDNIHTKTQASVRPIAGQIK